MKSSKNKPSAILSSSTARVSATSTYSLSGLELVMSSASLLSRPKPFLSADRRRSARPLMASCNGDCCWATSNVPRWCEGVEGPATGLHVQRLRRVSRGPDSFSLTGQVPPVHLVRSFEMSKQAVARSSLGHTAFLPMAALYPDEASPSASTRCRWCLDLNGNGR